MNDLKLDSSSLDSWMNDKKIIKVTESELGQIIAQLIFYRIEISNKADENTLNGLQRLINLLKSEQERIKGEQ
jgi:hypothetical protein